jgi:hypothetical protein
MLRLRSTEDGGRRHGISDGYRPDWVVLHHQGELTYDGGQISGLNGRVLEPGEAAEVVDWPFAPELWPLHEKWTGRDLVMMKGPTVVGVARVLGQEVANLRDLQKA